MNKRISFVFLALFSIEIFAGVTILTPENFDSVVDGSKNVFVKFFAPWCGHCKNMAADYETVADMFAKEKDVVIAEVDADAHKELGGRFDVHGFPTLKFFPKGSTTPEAYEGGRGIEDITTFVNGKVGSKIRVKKAPTAVVDLTSDNFDAIVMNSDKDVLVEFYAPWCGHCKKLAPDYEKVAAAFAGDADKVIVAKVDADAHKDLGSRFGVTGFPTIKWFPKGSKDAPEAYEQARDVKSFVEFINEKAGTQRTPTGALSERAGRISALDDIAAKFATAGADLSALVKEAQQVAKGLTGADAKSGKFYVKIMESIASKGKSFLESEPTRLEKMMAGSLTPAKADEFSIRKNILEAFLESE